MVWTLIGLSKQRELGAVAIRERNRRTTLLCLTLNYHICILCLPSHLAGVRKDRGGGALGTSASLAVPPPRVPPRVSGKNS